MEKELEFEENINILEKILNNKAYFIIIFGIIIRLFMLIYYYYSNYNNPQWYWGDIEAFFTENRASPPLSILLLSLFRVMSFGIVEIFVFWAFFCDLLVCFTFYFVLKSFNIQNMNYAWGLFLINPFYFLNNSFSIETCGYNIVDAFFFFCLFISLIYLPKNESRTNYLFYIFLGLSMCIKFYTLPALGFFFFKYIYEKNWKELRNFILIVGSIVLILLVIPLFLLESYTQTLLKFPTFGTVPILIRVIPIGIIFVSYTLFRLKKAEIYEIIIVSTIATGSFLFFSFTYIRWFQTLIFYGILSSRVFFSFKLNLGFTKREIEVNNHLLTFYLSFIGVLIAFIFILVGLS